jgi:L,D-transpeptidase YcbB
MGRGSLKILILLFVLSTTLLNAQQSAAQNGVEGLIRTVMEAGGPDERLSVSGTALHSSVVLHRFYQERHFKPAWIKDRKLTEIGYEMRYEINQARFDGLNPEDYHLNVINTYFNKIEQLQRSGQVSEEGDLAALDILLTDAYIMLSSHLYMGKVEPEQLKAIWNIQRAAPELMIDKRLEEALQSGSIRKSLENLYPSFVIYKKMRDGLRALYDDQKRFEAAPVSNWKKLKVDKSIKPGESHNAIPEIRRRLEFWGYLTPMPVEDEKLYDSLMVPGIKRIQLRHGMENDGVIGQGTIHALGQTPSDLISTAAVNLERLRWLPDKLKDQEIILVNTANFQLDYLLNRDTLFTSRVIVGKSYHATPQFDGLMSYIVFSPTWTVPTSIVRNEIIPALKKDPQYLGKKNMKLLTSDGKAIDPSGIDWSKVNARSFPYTVRQEPGEQNSLGLVKFMFPNKHSVYIHDTPSRSLFAREDRALSHGCVRIQKPFEFAKLLLSFDAQWTDERIRAAMKQTSERTVMLDRKIPVVMLYLTYWCDSLGKTFFRRDVYNRDEEILKALLEPRGKKSGI